MPSETARRWHAGGSDSGIAAEGNAERVQLDWLIDNSEAYESLIRGLRGARESIWISQLAFDADCKAYENERRESGTGSPGKNLIDAILAAAVQRRVSVRILLNSTLLLDTKRPLLRFLAEQKIDVGLVEVRGISRFPRLLHAKMVIIDEQRAFLMGSPFVNGYWDAPSHLPVDDRRPRRELGGRPIHDVSVAVRGAVVRDLTEIFARMWNGASREGSTHKRPIEARSIRNVRAELGVAVVTTEPRAGRDSSLDDGSRQTLDALLAGIQRARSLIYIEHQYLSSRKVVEALRRALDRERVIEIILVINQNPDVTAYRRWQNSRLADAGLLSHQRVGVFALWSVASGIGARPRLNQVFVHSKVVIIDDAWAMVGSANLDGASLDSYGDDFTGRLARRVFRDVRNLDVSLVFTSPESSSGPNRIRELRARLWTEHFTFDDFDSAERVADMDLVAWKDLAARNVASLNGCAENDEAAVAGSFVLPYSTSPRPREQLADAGIRPSASIDLEFDPGWLEVNFSPNWVRNMFI
jgi:phosphatidylserine/phosphatidylglycerophosphate/cardiolipin synthase-like enzyme